MALVGVFCLLGGVQHFSSFASNLVPQSCLFSSHMYTHSVRTAGPWLFWALGGGNWEQTLLV